MASPRRPYKHTVRNIIALGVYLIGYYGNTKGWIVVVQGREAAACWAKRRGAPPSLQVIRG